MAPTKFDIKSKAPRCGKYLTLDLVVKAMAILNQNKKDTYSIRIYEEDVPTEGLELATEYLLKVELLCNKTVIYTESTHIPKELDEEKLGKFIQGVVSLRIITNCLGSGLINYKLSTDGLAESFGSEVGNDRVSIIKRIIENFSSNSPPLIVRDWVNITTLPPFGDTLYVFNIQPMLYCTYEELLQCLKELQEGKQDEKDGIP